MKTIADMIHAKKSGDRIAMATCYDATFAAILESAKLDILLVGDSLGMVIKGEKNTLNVSVENVAYHTKVVAKGAPNSHITADMPFLSFTDAQTALQNAGRLIKAGAHSVKIEGGMKLAPIVSEMVGQGIPVMGHVGLMPQHFHIQGGFKIQGRDIEAHQRIVADALALQEAGAFALVVEGVPSALATEITSRVSIPTIGIGAGAACDGQVLVLYDLLGMIANFKPKFVKQFADGFGFMQQACQEYVNEVKSGQFPSKMHTFNGYPTLEV